MMDPLFIKLPAIAILAGIVTIAANYMPAGNAIKWTVLMVGIITILLLEISYMLERNKEWNFSAWLIKSSVDLFSAAIQSVKKEEKPD